ncbi:hypothetical protein BHE74_00018663 [Ensete ventricosum]|nr:hypothetical protein BHE74_00018663 [Ensete ventricosum]
MHPRLLSFRVRLELEVSGFHKSFPLRSFCHLCNKYTFGRNGTIDDFENGVGRHRRWCSDDVHVLSVAIGVVFPLAYNNNVSHRAPRNLRPHAVTNQNNAKLFTYFSGPLTKRDGSKRHPFLNQWNVTSYYFSAGEEKRHLQRPLATLPFLEFSRDVYA